MVSQTAEYALRAVVCLARNPRTAHTTQQIATATRIPAPYLSKILRMLSCAGFVNGMRGLNGGFLLQRSPAEMTLLDVIRAADPSRRIRTCPLHVHGQGLCEMHRRLDRAEAAFDEVLAATTVGEVLMEPEVQPVALGSKGSEESPSCSCGPA